MSVVRLSAHAVAKPWGRRRLPAGFERFADGGEPIGEIWFDPPEGDVPELLIKYLFTSEKLSVQVHPDDEGARARGYPRGKDEAWLILDAEPDSTIALGPLQALTPGELDAAAREGGIADLLHWQPVKAGDFIYSPAGTIHAIGSGVTLVEIQQNVDLTYRLYDYGRPRELHLAEGVEVSTLTPFAPPPRPRDGRLLAQGPKFVVEQLEAGEHRVDTRGKLAFFAPVSGAGSIAGQEFHAGECWAVTGATNIALGTGATALLTYPGDQTL